MRGSNEESGRKQRGMHTFQHEYRACVGRCDSDLGDCLNRPFVMTTEKCNHAYRSCKKVCDNMFGEAQDFR